MEKKITLKPACSYAFLDADYRFMIELMKIGSVHTLSSQVTLLSEKGGLSFRDTMGDKTVEGLQLPDNWFIEGVYPIENKQDSQAGLKMTFKVTTTAS